MWVHADEDNGNVPETKFCRRHYNYFQQYYTNQKKTTSTRDSEGTNFSNKRRRKKEAVAEVETGRIQPATTTSENSEFDTIIPEMGTKRSKIMEDDLSIDDTGIQRAASLTNKTSDKIIEGGSDSIRPNDVEMVSVELESFTRSRDPVVELESLEHYKSKCCELSMTLEEKKAECTKLQGELAKVETRRKNAFKGETERELAYATECWRKILADTTECWRKMFSDLESQVVLKMENVNSTMGSVESRISKLESLVLRSGKESSTLRCVKLQNSEDIVSESWDLPNIYDVGVNEHHEIGETSSGVRKDFHVYELKTKENLPNIYDIGVNEHHETKSEFLKYSAMNISSGSLHLSSGGENIEEGDGLVERPSQHHLEMSDKPVLNSVSDDDNESSHESIGEDSDSSTNSKSSLGNLMEMLAMKYRNKYKEIKWEFEADMLSSFEDDLELCMKAVCALYRRQISEDEASVKGLFHYSDALRITTLAKFLMNEDCKGDLEKSVEEFEIFDPKAVEDCNRLARSYSKQLFSIYQNKKDPYFLPTRTESHEDRSAK